MLNSLAGSGVFSNQARGDAEVGNLNAISFWIDDDIVRFNVFVNYLVLMNVTQTLDKLNGNFQELYWVDFCRV